MFFAAVLNLHQSFHRCEHTHSDSKWKCKRTLENLPGRVFFLLLFSFLAGGRRTIFFTNECQPRNSGLVLHILAYLKSLLWFQHVGAQTENRLDTGKRAQQLCQSLQKQIQQETKTPAQSKLQCNTGIQTCLLCLHLQKVQHHVAYNLFVSKGAMVKTRVLTRKTASCSTFLGHNFWADVTGAHRQQSCTDL